MPEMAYARHYQGHPGCIRGCQGFGIPDRTTRVDDRSNPGLSSNLDRIGEGEKCIRTEHDIVQLSQPLAFIRQGKLWGNLGKHFRPNLPLDFGDILHTYTVCEVAVAVAYTMLGKADPLAAALRLPSNS